MTGRMWVAVGAISALLVLCFCMACMAFVAVYPMPDSYYATRTARAWTPTALDTPTPLGTPTPRPTPQPSLRYTFGDGCGEPRTTEPFELREGKVEFMWDQGGTGSFGMWLDELSTGASHLILGPTRGHMAGSLTAYVAGGSYRLRIWCYATDFTVYVLQ